jgi:hypothetical protein
MELKKLKKQDWSTSTYSGEVPEEMCWKGRDMNSRRCTTQQYPWVLKSYISPVWSGHVVHGGGGRESWMGTPMISQYGKVKLATGYRISPKFYCHSPLSKTKWYPWTKTGDRRTLDRWNDSAAGRVKGRTFKWSSKRRGRRNSVLNVNWGFGTTNMFLDRSHMIHQKYRTCGRPLPFEGQVPEWPQVRFHVGGIRKWHTSS